MNLETALLKLKELLNSWNLSQVDWFLVLHYADMLNGYDIKYERDTHLHIMMPVDNVPWYTGKGGAEGEINIPQKTQHAIDFQKFIEETGWDFHIIAMSGKLFDKLQSKHVIERDIHGEKIPVITVEGNFVYWRYSVPLWSKQLSRDSVLRRFEWMELLLEKARERGDKKIVKMAESLINKFKPKDVDSSDIEKRVKDFEKSGKLRGISAFGGKIIGKVFKIKNPDKPMKVEQGKILVAKLASPKMFPNMAASLSVITDEGGLTSHAAIVCRELKKICIVGTKIATEVLNDGDWVEVDAERGIVKKISSSNSLSVLSLPWKYYVSRNVPIWHDELNLLYNNDRRGWPMYKLPAFYSQLRVHHGDSADFYHLVNGEYGRKKLSIALSENFSKPRYCSFLIKKYRDNGQKFLCLARGLKLNEKSMSEFFIFYGLSCVMLDITALGGKVVTNKIFELLGDCSNHVKIFARYAKPKMLSPLQKMEKELVGLRGKKIDVAREAKKLHKKYCWIPVNFMGEPWGVQHFVDSLEGSLSLRDNSEQSRWIASSANGLLAMTEETKYWLRVLGSIAGLNEYRKGIFSQVSLTIRPLLDKLAKEHELGGWRDVNFLAHDEILDLLRGKDDYQKDLIDKRRELCAVYTSGLHEVGFFYGNDVLKFQNKFKPKSGGIQEVCGVAAHGGKVTGTVKIINGPVDFHKFKQGDILIAKMTSVDFIPIMKMAGAFVTDEGGLACHAAIISREYDKPCVVGTGLATVVFKDGDCVEVDTNLGVVKKV